MVDLTSLQEASVAADSDLMKAAANFERVRELAALAQLRGKDAGRILEHTSRVRSTLENLKRELRQRSIANIELRVLQCYQQLLGKQNLIAGLRFDPETCTPTLCTSDGSELHIDSLSAGERQLFAVALLWGLALVSGRPLPTIVDTPLGRLDGVHRRTLVDRYFPHAAEQVILLSTDEEIDEDLASCLESSTGRWYRLEYDEVLRSTRVVNGYFFEGELSHA
jgi:DNA sulfur modification protein DndD